MHYQNKIINIELVNFIIIIKDFSLNKKIFYIV